MWVQIKSNEKNFYFPPNRNLPQHPNTNAKKKEKPSAISFGALETFHYNLRNPNFSPANAQLDLRLRYDCVLIFESSNLDF